MRSLAIEKCFVVTRSSQDSAVLFAAVDLDSSSAFARAQSYVRTFNQLTRTGKAVIRPAQASLAWNARGTVAAPHR
jgi:hypothetical protein